MPNPITFPFIDNTPFLNQLFLQSWLDIKLFGYPTTHEYGLRLNLIDIIVLVLIAYVVSWVTKRLTGKTVGSTLTATIITLLGVFVILTFANLPSGLDFAIYDVQIIPALLGAIIIAVFYTLIRDQFKSKGGGH